METIVINLIDTVGCEMKYNVIERHNGYIIVSSEAFPEVVEVYVPAKNTLFVVGLDDSKRCGYRTFNEDANTVKNAKEYINWLEKKI